jgi:hypothetical protein
MQLQHHAEEKRKPKLMKLEERQEQGRLTARAMQLQHHA